MSIKRKTMRTVEGGLARRVADLEKRVSNLETQIVQVHQMRKEEKNLNATYFQQHAALVVFVCDQMGWSLSLENGKPPAMTRKTGLVTPNGQTIV